MIKVKRLIQKIRKPNNQQSNGSPKKSEEIQEVDAGTSGQHTVVNISDSDPLQNSIIEAFNNLNARNVFHNPNTYWNTNKSRISRFPLHIRERNESDIRPTVVSIGPFHKNMNLGGMEQKKMEFMWVMLLSSSSDPMLPPLLEKIRALETKARECYSETIILSNDDFVQMLLLDSCFIIYVIIAISREMHESLISLDWNIKEIRSDLLLLENQIPLLIVHAVYSIFQKLTSWDLPDDLAKVLDQFIYMDIPWRFHDKLPCDEANHLLELYWKCFLPKFNQISLVQGESPPPPNSSDPNFAELAVASGAIKNIPSATELDRVAGVKFKSRSLPSYSKDWGVPLNRSCAHRLLNDICAHALMYFKPVAEAFSCCVPFLCYSDHNNRLFVAFRNGIIEMPSLKIDQSMKIILTNLIGYEKCIPFDMRKVSSYMLLMDSLINTEEDVELLQRRGVIINTLSTTSSATIFFNEIGNLCTVDYQKHLFADLFKDVNEHYNMTWNRRFAKLRHSYFNSPWAAISVFANSCRPSDLLYCLSLLSSSVLSLISRLTCFLSFL